jgi:hypothetical protein
LLCQETSIKNYAVHLFYIERLKLWKIITL